MVSPWLQKPGKRNSGKGGARAEEKTPGECGVKPKNVAVMACLEEIDLQTVNV
jgi:hypothetical protein